MEERHRDLIAYEIRRSPNLVGVDGAARNSDEQFAEWYVWAKREISSDNRVCLGAAQAAIHALDDGGDLQAARGAARRSTAGHGVVLLANVSPRRRAYAEWYDWARREIRGAPDRLHRTTRAAIECLERGGSSEEAADVARRAAGPGQPAPVVLPVLAPTGPHGPGEQERVPAPPLGTVSHPSAVPPAAAVPTAMRASPHGLPPAAEARQVYASFWRRVAAWIADLVFVFIGLFAVDFVIAFFYALGLGASGREIPAEDLGLGYFTIGVSFVLTWLYYAGLESSPMQATFGKRMLDAVVTDVHGRRVSFLRATARYFGKIVSALPLGGGYVLVAGTARKQALHDLIAGTLVLRRSHVPSTGPIRHPAHAASTGAAQQV